MGSRGKLCFWLKPPIKHKSLKTNKNYLAELNDYLFSSPKPIYFYLDKADFLFYENI